MTLIGPYLQRVFLPTVAARAPVTKRFLVATPNISEETGFEKFMPLSLIARPTN